MKGKMRLGRSCAVLGMLISVSVQAQRDFEEIEIQSQHVGGNVHMLEGAGGNIGVSVGEDGILLIDDQFAPLSEKIEAALEELSNGKELKFVLNTHWHQDHTSGNPYFGRRAPIIAHSNVRARLAGQQASGRGFSPAMEKEGLPVITFDESLSIHFNGEKIRVLHFPKGHTDGDSVIFFEESNVVHTGDHLFNGRFPFIDLESGGTVQGYIANVEKVLEQLPSDAGVIPGHGPLGDVDDLEQFHRMLSETTQWVREKAEAGESLDEIQAEGVPDRWTDWAWDFVDADRWIETIYNSHGRTAGGDD